MKKLLILFLLISSEGMAEIKCRDHGASLKACDMGSEECLLNYNNGGWNILRCFSKSKSK